jgi:hypothetical protein
LPAEVLSPMKPVRILLIVIVVLYFAYRTMTIPEPPATPAVGGS